MAHCSDEEARVLDAVDERRLVERLSQLVAVPSVGGTPAESEAQHLVADWLEELDCDVDRWSVDLDEAARAADAPGQEVSRSDAWGVVGTLPGREGGTPALVFCGHTDVVPAGEPSRWSGDPFVPRLSGGWLYGRGACDMKGGLAAVLGAVEALRTAGVRPLRPVAVHSVVGEEDGGLGAWATLRRGHTGEACVIPEPTAGAVVTAHAGALTFRLEVTGRSAHAAFRGDGVSAVQLFEELHADLRAFEADRQADPDPRFGDLRLPYALSIGTVRAGNWASAVPETLVAEGRYGVRVGEPVEQARAELEARVAAFCAGHAWLSLHPARVVWTGGTFASGDLPAGDPLLTRVRAAVADAGGHPLAERAMPAGTDLRLYAAAGVPTLHYGPGDLRLAHAPDERVPVADVVAAARAFALLALRAGSGA